MLKKRYNILIWHFNFWPAAVALKGLTFGPYSPFAWLATLGLYLNWTDPSIGRLVAKQTGLTLFFVLMGWVGICIHINYFEIYYSSIMIQMHLGHTFSFNAFLLFVFCRKSFVLLVATLIPPSLKSHGGSDCGGPTCSESFLSWQACFLLWAASHTDTILPGNQDHKKRCAGKSVQEPTGDFSDLEPVWNRGQKPIRCPSKLAGEPTLLAVSAFDLLTVEIRPQLDMTFETVSFYPAEGARGPVLKTKSSLAAIRFAKSKSLAMHPINIFRALLKVSLQGTFTKSYLKPNPGERLDSGLGSNSCGSISCAKLQLHDCRCCMSYIWPDYWKVGSCRIFSCRQIHKNKASEILNMTQYQLCSLSFSPYDAKWGRSMEFLQVAIGRGGRSPSFLTSGQPEVLMGEVDGNKGEGVEKKKAWSARWKLPRWPNWPAGEWHSRQMTSPHDAACVALWCLLQMLCSCSRSPIERNAPVSADG